MTKKIKTTMLICSFVLLASCSLRPIVGPTKNSWYSQSLMPSNQSLQIIADQQREGDRCHSK